MLPNAQDSIFRVDFGDINIWVLITGNCEIYTKVTPCKKTSAQKRKLNKSETGEAITTEVFWLFFLSFILF